MRGEVLVVAVDRDGRLVRDRAHDGAVCVEKLDESIRFGELRTAELFVSGHAGLRRPRLVVGESTLDARIVRALQQEPVGRGAQLALRADVRGVDRSEHDERERCRHREQQPDAQAHAGRTVYPMPRIVWMSRGASSTSVLRRRYPM